MYVLVGLRCVTFVAYSASRIFSILVLLDPLMRISASAGGCCLTHAAADVESGKYKKG